jgi:HEAT repeat protein
MDANPQCAEIALQSLMQQDAVSMLPELLHYLRWRQTQGLNNGTMALTVANLIASKQPATVTVLQQLAQSPNLLERLDALWGARYLKPLYAVAILAHAAAHDAQPEVRVAAIGTLGAFRLDAAVSAIAHALDDSNEEVRAKAALTLCRNATDVAVPALERALHDPVATIRTLAHMALNRAQPPTCWRVSSLMRLARFCRRAATAWQRAPM